MEGEQELPPGNSDNVDSEEPVYQARRRSPNLGVKLLSRISELGDAALGAMQKEQLDFRYALDRASMLAITDARGRITYANDRFCKKSGYSREELIGQDHRLINSGFHSKEFFSELWSTIRSGKVWEGEIRNRSKSGSFYWVHTVIVPFLDADGQPERYVAIRTDITQRKQAEQEKAALLVSESAAIQASHLKSQFIANVSHEIRTPLNAVIGMTELLSVTAMTEEQRNCVKVIQGSASVLSRLIEDLLDFSRIESGKLRLEETPFDVKATVLEVGQMFGKMADDKNLRLDIECATLIPLPLRGDPTRFRQVLVNLVSNAVKFTDRGTVKIRMGCERQTVSYAQIMVEVEDTGIGISTEELARLYKPFVQLDSSTTRKYSGSGLGLSICKHLVELMGGELGVESSPRVGSRFWFRVPLRKQDALPESRFADMLSPSFPPDTHVLLVEDTPVNQEVTLLLLESIGISADVVSNGVAALESLNRRSYSLVLMDCQMPELDGYGATRLIREHPNEKIRSVPVVALTASAMAEDRERCIQAGMDDYLSKPIRRDDLRRCIAFWLAETRLDPAAEARTQEPPTLAWKVVKDLQELGAENGSDFVAEMLGLFSKNGAERLECLKRAIGSADWRGVAKEAHALKSSGAYLGAARLGKLCDQLQSLAMREDAAALSPLISRIESEYSLVVRELREYLLGVKPPAVHSSVVSAQVQ